MKIDRIYEYGKDWNITKHDTGILYEFNVCGFSNKEFIINIDVDDTAKAFLSIVGKKDSGAIGTRKEFTMKVSVGDAALFNFIFSLYCTKDGVLFVFLPYKKDKPIGASGYNVQYGEIDESMLHYPSINNNLDKTEIATDLNSVKKDPECYSNTRIVPMFNNENSAGGASCAPTSDVPNFKVPNFKVSKREMREPPFKKAFPHYLRRGSDGKLHIVK